MLCRTPPWSSALPPAAPTAPARSALRPSTGGDGLISDWKVGSPVLWQSGPDTEPRDLDQFVLESVPHRRLAYSWHSAQPEHAEVFGWTEERLAELRQERRSRVAFDLEPVRPGVVKLTVTHDDFEPGSEMLEAVSGRTDKTGGWPEIVANLKTLLETGEALEPLESVAG